MNAEMWEVELSTKSSDLQVCLCACGSVQSGVCLVPVGWGSAYAAEGPFTGWEVRAVAQ